MPLWSPRITRKKGIRRGKVAPAKAMNTAKARKRQRTAGHRPIEQETTIRFVPVSPKLNECSERH